MGFFTDLFHSEKKEESVVLIDIGTASVAGAYAYYREGEPPVLLYSRRLPVETRESEPQEQAMLRALHMLGEMLIREGAPLLARATLSGSASASNILVSIDAPWQKTSVRTEHFEEKTPFTFSRSLVRKALEKTGAAGPGQILADESIIGTILNGYETNDPYGKEVRRASIVILTSLIDEPVAKGIQSAVRSLYHTSDIVTIAGSSLRYQALRAAFPHERDALILDATGPLTSIALVRRDLLVEVREVPSHRTGTGAWLKAVTDELAEFAERFPLPRTIFLLARESDSAGLQKTLDAAKLGELWLSDNPPKIVSVLASHLSALVRQVSTSPPDLLLLLMGLYWQNRIPEE